MYSLTNVPPERQKILGLVKGKLPPEDARMYVLDPTPLLVVAVFLCFLLTSTHSRGDLKLVSGKKFSLVGTPEGHEFKDPSRTFDLAPVIRPRRIPSRTDTAILKR